jgi:hypothetical protein
MSSNQTITNCVFMVRPLHFCMNEQTAVTNHFQRQDDRYSDYSQLLAHVQGEFDGYVQTLREAGVDVIVIEDRPDVVTPDSIFPNNWIVSDRNGTVSLFPMCAFNRRLERRDDVIEELRSKGYKVNEIVDFSKTEKDGRFLEGTGSMILDRQYHRAYCALSPRSDKDLLEEFCRRFQYKPVAFHAYQTVPSSGKRAEIYHTNVMLTVAEEFAVVCLACIDSPEERKTVTEELTASGKEIIEISEEQVASFAGNMLQVSRKDGQRYLVMSQTAHLCLTSAQVSAINKYCSILTVDIAMIEKLGGGSARCMLAEVFLPTV